MLKVTVLTPTEYGGEVVELLSELDGVFHVVRLSTEDPVGSPDVVNAFVQSQRVDTVLVQLAAVRNWLPGEISFVDVNLMVGYAAQQMDDSAGLGAGDGTISDVMMVARARGEARLTWWYLAFMVCAAIVGAIGVGADLPILIVGAMSLSPDLDPANAAAVGFAVKDTRRAIKALGTLVVGLLLAVITAWITTRIAMSLSGNTSALANADANIVTFVSVVDAVTIVVAIVAGIAAMVAFVTDQARTAVGVAISVTTIPAAAYIGLALASNAPEEALGGLAVLTVNVVLLVLAQLVTLALLRLFRMFRTKRATV